MAYPIFADSYGGIGAQLQNQAAMAQRQREVAFANLLQAVQFASAMDQRRREEAAQNQLRRLAFDEGVRQFNVRDLGDQAYLSFQRERLDNAPPSTADMRAALTAVSGGRKPPAGNYTPGQEEQLSQAQAEYSQAYNEQKALADALTARETMAARLLREKTLPKPAPLWRRLLGSLPPSVGPVVNPLLLFGGPPDATAGSAPLPLPPEYMARLEAKAKATADNVPPLTARELNEMVRPRMRRLSPVVRGYETLLQEPQWEQRTTNAPAAERSSDVAPSVTIARPVAENTYQPGARYGNIYYLGPVVPIGSGLPGDPNLESSWSPFKPALKR